LAEAIEQEKASGVSDHQCSESVDDWAVTVGYLADGVLENGEPYPEVSLAWHPKGEAKGE
jgi:hypothetical protein